jgi:hypothetical protein
LPASWRTPGPLKCRPRLGPTQHASRHKPNVLVQIRSWSAFTACLCLLLERSGWTQEKLAEKEGKTQPWITYRLRFGRFLGFITTVIKIETLPKNLTEGRFRSFWEQAAAVWAVSQFYIHGYKI